jgi:hypothetical protein
MATTVFSPSEEEKAVVSKADVQSAADRFREFVASLPAREKEVVGWLMDRAGSVPPLAPLHIKYHPRGAKHLVVGGADGLLVLISRSGIHVTPPEGPLPTDIVGAGIIPPER